MDKKEVSKRIFELNPLVYGAGNIIKSYRIKKGYSRVAFAKKLKLDLSYLQDCEKETAGIRLKTLSKIWNKKILIKIFLKNKVLLRFNGAHKKFNYSHVLKQTKRHDSYYKIQLAKTDFRVCISKGMISLIKERCCLFGGTYLLYNCTEVTPTIFFRLLKGEGINVKYYLQILDFLNIPIQEGKKAVKWVTYNGSKFIYPYLEGQDVLMFRIICHIIGDGTIASKETARWVQHTKNSHWLKDLIKLKIGFQPTSSKVADDIPCEYVTISAYFSRWLRYNYQLDVKRLKTGNEIRKVLRLSKEHQLQLLAAFIVDEGHIRYKRKFKKGARSCVISQVNKDTLEAIVKILDSCGYNHSQFYKEINHKSNTITYRVNIYREGVVKFYYDLKKMKNKYGIFAGLWQKQEALENYILTIKHNKNKC